MAITKKIKKINRIGLLSGPSRKQADITNTPSLREQAKAATQLYFTGFISGGAPPDIVFMTVNKNQIVRVLSVSISANGVVLTALTVLKNTFTLTYLHNNVSSNSSIAWPYDTAPVLREGEKLQFSSLGGPGDAYCNVLVMVESI
jgi:hypothetical protein